MIADTKDCDDCREEDGVLYLCENHGILMDVSIWGLSHQFACEECCDVPQMKRLIDRWGIEKIKDSIPLLREGQKEYARYIISEAIKEDK